MNSIDIIAPCSFLILVILVVRKQFHTWVIRSYLKDAEWTKNTALIQKCKQELKWCYLMLFIYVISFFAFAITVSFLVKWYG